MVPNFPYWGKKKGQEGVWTRPQGKDMGRVLLVLLCSGSWENSYHSLSTFSHCQMSDVIKGHLQMVEAQGQDESVSLEEGCQAVTHSALH